MKRAGPVSLSRITFQGRCPRCGSGKLFKTWLQVAPQCDNCHLSFSGHEQGDGPAFFGVLIVGALAAIGAAVVEIHYQPSFWLHAAIWVPFIIVASLFSLRWLKAALIGAQYLLRSQDFKDKE